LLENVTATKSLLRLTTHKFRFQATVLSQ